MPADLNLVPWHITQAIVHKCVSLMPGSGGKPKASIFALTFFLLFAIAMGNNILDASVCLAASSKLPKLPHSFNPLTPEVKP